MARRQIGEPTNRTRAMADEQMAAVSLSIDKTEALIHTAALFVPIFYTAIGLYIPCEMLAHPTASVYCLAGINGILENQAPWPIT